MNLLDRVRIARAVASYDWWLDLRGARGGRRRELRQELKTNLADAAEHVGVRAAVASLGSTRQMAADALPADRTRARWLAGLQAGIAAVAVTALLQSLLALAWLDGATAAAGDEPVRGSITLMPGSSLEFVPQATGFSMSVALGWSALVVGAAVLVVVARPWRALGSTSRQSASRVAADA